MIPLNRASRLLFHGPCDLAQATGLSEPTIGAAMRGEHHDVRTLERLLAAMGLQLAIVSADASQLQIPDREVLLAAMTRARAAGQPERGLRARFARLLGIDRAAVTGVLDSGERLGVGARERLHQHMLEPGAHPLPPPGAEGRPKKSTDP